MSKNEKKCIVIHFGNNNPHFKYLINSNVPKTTILFRDLGIHVDANLKFVEHLKFIKSKCFKLTNLIFRNFRVKKFSLL